MMLKVVRVQTDVDLRSLHKYRLSFALKALKPGEVVMQLNFRQTKARLLDSTRAVHTYYAPDNQVFDVEAIQKVVKSGLGLTLSVPAAQVDRMKRARPDAERERRAS